LLIRMGLAAPGTFQARGFQVTSVAGTLVAALVAAELWNLDDDKCVMAMGIALSQASGVFEFLTNASSVKSLHPGWAAHAGISTQSRKAYETVIRITPNDPEAREALGFVQLDGRWVTEEESYKARGFVRFQGEWMTPAEVQVHETTQANEQAARDAEQRAIDAEVAQAKAEHEAQEAQKRADEAEEDARRYSNPIYWGGYGYGVGYWPATTGYTVNYRGRSISR